ARLLPKTLFGERYVELVVPSDAASQPLRAGAVIGQDRTSAAIELERVLDGALPLLQAIEPEKLAAILGSLAHALEGRGEQLGRDLVTLDGLLTRLNAELPTLTEDLRLLAPVLEAYDGAAEDLLAILRDLTVTATTLHDQRVQLAGFLADTADLADTTRSFLDRHDDRIIRLGQVSRPVLELLAAYAPEYPCLLQGVVALQPQVEAAFAGGRMHITLEITRDGGKYLPGRDTPVYRGSGGPQCHGLPRPKVPAPTSPPMNDGYDHSAHRGLITMGVAGTAEEQALIKPLVGAATGAPASEVPDVVVLLWGPLLRGTVVDAV
ncbi:MAG TPA: MCE family protein, partial [Micromonosporaceae bacterium]|nr:MCE family protein [Micromonosporaceae bacterium]